MTTNINNLTDIVSEPVIEKIKKIKEILKRSKEEDLQRLDFAHRYEKLVAEFPEFVEKHPSIFNKILREESMDIIAASLYYRDRIDRGLMTERELGDMLATQYFPKHLKEESDAKINDMNK